MKKSFLTLTLLLGLCAALPAQSPAGAKKAEAAKDSTKTAAKSDYDKLFADKSHVCAKGMITLHQVKGKLYFELPLSLLGRDLLLGSTITQISDNANGIVGSKPSEPLHLSFTMEQKQVQMRNVSSGYSIDDPNSPLAAAVAKSTLGPVVLNKKIEAWTADSTAVVFEMTDYFVSDNKRLSPFDEFSLYTLSGYQRNASFERDKSYLVGIKAFEDNVSIQSCLSYKYSLSTQEGKKALSDAPFSAIVTRSLILLPEQPYRSRIGDYRMAIFPTAKERISAKDQRITAQYVSNRWRLEPSDEEAYRRGEKVEPKQPIVFYVDSTFPNLWKPYIHEAINQWSEVFEAETGFKNAVVAKDFPKDDPAFDPDNLKYSCVRYAPVAIPNAMGPSWVDPRSGEIINASVYVYHDITALLNRWMFVQTAAVDPRVRSLKLPDEVLGDGLRYVIAHEVGHCLGLMHNMSASAVIPVDSLRSPSYTQKYGTTTSIMDYARFNYVAQPGDFEKGVRLMPPRFGVYDHWTIKWLYTSMNHLSPEAEADTLERWIHEAIKDPVYRYGKQLASAIDPRSQTEDLGDNAVRATQYGLENLKRIVAHFYEWIGDADKDFSHRTKIYDAIVSQYVTYLNHVAAYVGGMYIQEIKSADEGQAYTNIPKEKQQEAFQYLCSLMGTNDWIDLPQDEPKLGPMGKVSVLLDNALAKALVGFPFKVSNFQDLGTDNYTFAQCLQDLSDFVWQPVKDRRDPTPAQIELQKLYVNNVMLSSGMAKAEAQGRNMAAQATSLEEICATGQIRLPGWEEVPTLAQLDRNYAGYGGFGIKFARITRDTAQWYTRLLEAQKMAEKGMRSSQGEARAHYRLLLTNIQNCLKEQ